jgi:CrcB protein
MSFLVAALAGSIGALGRYVVSGLVQRRMRSTFPVGTAAVNVIGALALGLAIGSGGTENVVVTAMAGFLGGFTTFSTWMIETSRLGLVPKPTARAIVNLAVLPLLGVAAAALGYYMRG